MAGNGKSRLTDRAAAAANRLRAVQADLAESEPASRKDFLLEEIDNALTGQGPDERQQFLEKLKEQFPAWDAVQAPPVKANNPPPEVRDWEYLVGKLAEIAPTLTEANKQAATEKLRAVGLAPPSVVSGSGWSAEQTAALRNKLQLAQGEQLNSNRLIDLLDLLCELAIGLDVLAWNTWKQIAPQSPTRRQTPLQRTLARCAAGDSETPRTHTAAEIGRLRRLLAAMISSVGQVGGKFAQDYCGQFAPSQIEDVVKAQGGGGIFGNPKVRFWDQYVQMAATRDPASVEHEFVTAFAQYAELLMKAR